MSRDEITAEWKNNRLTIINETLAPMYIAATGNVDHWLEMRAIDSHRANSRLLKKALRMTDTTDICTVLSVNAATITDNYWIKPLDSVLTYAEIRFDNDYFSKLALRGGYDSFNKAANSKRSRTPELTNIGSFEKCWKLIDGEWWMYKKADHNEQFSELFTFELGKLLGMNMAEYAKGNKCVKTKDFTDNAALNFEPAYSFLGSNEEYVYVIKKLNELSADLIPDYMKMIFLDTIVANPDRHTFNFGILRKPETGEIVGFAPNFDNNMALISRGYPNNIERKNDVLIKYFNELLEYDKSLIQYIPTLKRTEIEIVLKTLNMKVRTELITNFIMNGYEKIYII